MTGMRREAIAVGLLVFASCSIRLVAADPAARKAEKRQLVNPREVYREIKVPAGVESAVAQYFSSFRDYQELMLYHPKFGYYSSGRVSFTEDFETYPVLLAPYFGQMIAQQIFRMWEGMRRAGTLGHEEKFTIAEFGAGNGVLAETILDYVDQQAREDREGRWREMVSQLVYVCYDRAPALREAQLRRNARFARQFESRDGDATDFNRTIPAATLKGVVLSNEMLDVFGVQKVILSENGTAEAAFVAPFLPAKTWNQLKSRVAPALEQSITRGNRMIRNAILPSDPDSDVYLSREAFLQLLEFTAEWKDYISAARAIQFHELYLPARVIPELQEHLQRYAPMYAVEVARSGKGVVTYINLGEGRFIRGAAQALKVGYVITVDYGANWDGIMASTLPHMRTYGPGNLESVSNDLLAGLAAAHGPGSEGLAQAAPLPENSGRGNPDPYRSPTLNDLTTDVNFSYLAAEGQSSGLKAVFFGPQRALRSGTSISTKNTALQSASREKQLHSWREFETDPTFKVLVQQKSGTDDSYVYPESHNEALEVNEKGLNETQRKRAAEIEQKLRAQ